MPHWAAYFDGTTSGPHRGSFREVDGEMASTILFNEVEKRRADFWRIANDPKRPFTERFLAAGSCGTMATDADDAAHAKYLRAFDFASLAKGNRLPVRRSLAMHPRGKGFLPQSVAVLAEWAENDLMDAFLFAEHVTRRPTAHFNSILLRLLAKPGETGKGKICLSLGMTGDEGVRPALWEATKLDKPRDQIGALSGLIHLGLPEHELVKVVDQLLAAAPKYRHSDLMVIPALGKANVPAARKWLVAKSLTGNENDVYRALGALRELNAPEALPLLKKLAADKEGSAPSAARQHLWELGQRK